MDNATRPSSILHRIVASLQRQGETFVFVLRVVLPLILRDRRRPVIFSRYTGMGDIICTIPAARELMKRHPDATFIYNCNEHFAEVPRIAGVADRITSLKSIGQLGHWYRFLFAGFYHFSHADDTPGAVVSEPMVADFCRQFGLPVTDRHPSLSIRREAKQRAERILAERNLDPAALIVVHPGPSWTIKEWPRESWTRLVAELRSRGHRQIVQLGVSNYSVAGATAVPIIPGAISLVDLLSIEESMAIISLARLFVGIDSGLLHIAACTKTPSVGLFGPTDPQFFYEADFRRHFVRATVDCVGCEHRRPRLHWLMGCSFDIQCMQSIKTEFVLDRCLACLGAAQPNATVPGL